MFLKIFKHLLPRARAWKITLDKNLRRFFDGLTDLPATIKQFFDDAYLDLFPDTTRELEAFEEQFNLGDPSGLTEQERRDRLTAAWQALGGQDPRYIQDLLQLNGFDVYLHEWWKPETRPAVNDPSCAEPRNPFDVIEGFTSSLTMGDPAVTFGSGATMGGNEVLKGYLLLNAEQEVRLDRPYTMGSQITTMGSGATMGYVEGVTFERKVFGIPTDPNCWKYILYIGGQNFGDVAQIPANRRKEFETLCLKICPTQQWLGMIVEYV